MQRLVNIIAVAQGSGAFINRVFPHGQVIGGVALHIGQAQVGKVLRLCGGVNRFRRVAVGQKLSVGQPLVSIIVPVYNAADHIARCIESIRRQTYRNLEIILLNDGSKDVSYAVCQSYAGIDRRIVVIDKNNSGVSATRNLGMQEAHGKYFQFVDADDFIQPYATELLVQKAEASHADMVIAHYNRIEPPVSLPKTMRDTVVERVLDPILDPQHRVQTFGFLMEGPLNKDAFACGLMQEPASFYYGVMWNKLYRADIVREHPDVRCNEELDYSEDLYFNLSFIRYAQQFYALSTPIYNYVQNPDSAVHHLNPFDVLTTRFELTTYYKDLFKHIGLYEENKYRLNKFFFGVAES